MPNIPLDRLDEHPGNANRMGESLLEKLIVHLRESGDYPPLIVRLHPAKKDRYQILDGHHRAKALRRLGHPHARCEVWEVDDQRADLLLATLNRLRGDDDPYRRGELLARLAGSMGVKALASHLPEDVSRIDKLIAATQLPPAPAQPPDLATMPQAVTFFLTAGQRDRLFKKLRPLTRDRSAALVELLALDEPTGA
ncbi:MAG: ParB-like nuclease domain-containing protein [Planctomycetes bacterium]|nr:ParB-like nuclease domain-containing protein [Planctomycetota bacterium]